MKEQRQGSGGPLKHSAQFSIILGVVFLVCVLGCSGPRLAEPSRDPLFVILQFPDCPLVGQDSRFPGGLVAAFWPDGRVVRATSESDVGQSYVLGMLPPEGRQELLSVLDIAAKRATKGDGIPLHSAFQVITVRSESGLAQWNRVLPDTNSVWSEVQSPLLGLALRESSTVSAEEAERLW
jgi:hypothetical protein